jgi:hypothetical protein
MDASSAEYIEMQRNSTYVRLQYTDWQSLYRDKYVTKYGDLYLGIDSVAFGVPFNQTAAFAPISDHLPREVSLVGFKNHPSFGDGWKLSQRVFASQLPNGDIESVNETMPLAVHIKEGLTIDNGRNSLIQVNLYFMIVVLSFNLFKLIIMVSVLVMDQSEYLVTLGDAAASFLERPEQLTYGKCTLETDDLFSSYKSSSKVDESNVSDGEGVATRLHGAWQPRSRRYCSSIGFDKAWSATIS